MLKHSLLFLAFALSVSKSIAVDFTSLSREKPVTVSYAADRNSNVSFMLSVKSLKENRLDIFLRVCYIIDSDTLNDYLYLDESYNGMIKEIYVHQGDSVKAFIYLNNDETVKIDNLKGSFSVKSAPGIDMHSSGDVCRFTGSVWKDDQLPLFRISKTNEQNQLLSLDIALTENFEFDKLFLKIKIISPAQGIQLYTKELVVNEEPELPYRRKTMKIDFTDLEVQKSGSYYVQVFHLMSQKRINGVESVAYRLTDK